MDCLQFDNRGMEGKISPQCMQFKEFIPVMEKGISNYIMEPNKGSYNPNESYTYGDKEHDHIERKMKRIIRKKHKRSRIRNQRSKSWLSSTDLSSDFDDTCWLSKSLTNSFDDSEEARIVRHLSRLSKEANWRKRRNERKKSLRDRSWLSSSEMSLGSDETCWLYSRDTSNCRTKMTYKFDRYKSKRIRNWVRESSMLSDSDEEYWLTRALKRTVNDERKQKRHVRYSYIDVARWLPAITRNVAEGRFQDMNKLTFTQKRAVCREAWLGWEVTSWIDSVGAEFGAADAAENANKKQTQDLLQTGIQVDTNSKEQTVTNDSSLRHSQYGNYNERSVEVAAKRKPRKTYTLQRKAHMPLGEHAAYKNETHVGDVPCSYKRDKITPGYDSHSSLKLESREQHIHQTIVQSTLPGCLMKSAADCGNNSALISSNNETPTSNLVDGGQMCATSPLFNRRPFTRFTISDSTESGVHSRDMKQFGDKTS